MRTPTVVAAALALVLAGCTSDSTPQADPGITFDDPSLGIVRGQVVSEEQQPIADAAVAIDDLGRGAATDVTGSFLIEGVPPGPHTLSITAPGFASVTVPIEVRASEVTEVVRALTANPSDGPHGEVFPFVGFEACQWYLPFALAHCSLPYTQAHGTLNRYGVNLSQAGLPPDIQANRDRYNFTVRPNSTGIVSELIWKASSAAATWQALVLACAWYDPTWDECVPPGSVSTGERYYGVIGTSPIRLEWVHEHPEHLPWVTSRANVNGNTTDLRPAGFALDQRIEMYNTVFYGMDPPEGYTAGPPDA